MIQAPFWGKGAEYDVFAGKKTLNKENIFQTKKLLSEGHELETLRVLSKIWRGNEK